MIDHKNYCSVLKTGECNCQQIDQVVSSSSGTFGPLKHDGDDPHECPACIAEKAVFVGPHTPEQAAMVLRGVVPLIPVNVPFGTVE